jgi:hypothetical protein
MMPEQGLDQLATAVDLELAAGVVLEPPDRLRDVASEQGRVVPGHPVQGSRHKAAGPPDPFGHDLAHRVVK